MFVKELRDDWPRPRVTDLGRRVYSIDDHAVAEGCGVGDEDSVDVADGTAADAPEDLGGGVCLNVA